MLLKDTKVVVLKYDVDLLPQNSLRFAIIQNDLGIKGSYYFRVVPESWDEEIIAKIAGLNHEVGYHYETMDTAKGDIDLAMDQFKKHLEELRDLVDVKTICMVVQDQSSIIKKSGKNTIIKILELLVNLILM